MANDVHSDDDVFESDISMIMLMDASDVQDELVGNELDGIDDE